MIFRAFLKYYYVKKLSGKNTIDDMNDADIILMKRWLSSSHNNMKKNFIIVAKALNKDLTKYFPEGIYKTTKNGTKKYGKCIIPDEEVDSLCDVLYTFDSKISRLSRGSEENYNFIDLQKDLFKTYGVESEDELLKKAAENDYISSVLTKINYFLHKQYYLFYKEIIKEYNDKLSSLMFPSIAPNEAQLFARFYSCMLKNLSTLLDQVLDIFIALRDDILFNDALDESLSENDILNDDIIPDVNIENIFNQAVRTYIEENDFNTIFKYSLSDDRKLLDYTSKQDNGLYEKCKLSDIDWIKNIDIEDIGL